MNTVTSTQADRIAARTAKIVATMRAEADALEAAGGPSDVLDPTYPSITRASAVEDIRRTADSRERAGARAKVGAKIGRA